MSITSKRSTAFVKDLADGGVHTKTDTYKAVLIKTGHTGTYDERLTNVGTPGSGSPGFANVGTDEVSGAGYTTGGISLGAPSITVVGEEVHINFADPTPLSNCTFSADGAVIYNVTRAGKVLGCFSFGSAKAPSDGTFSLDLPTAGASTSLLRL